MRTAPRRLALFATAALAAGAAAKADAQDSVVITGTVEESFGAEGFVMTVGGEELAVATGQLREDNPRLRVTEGDVVTVYAAPDEAFLREAIVDADGLRVQGSGGLVRVRDGAVDDAVYGMRRSAREALTARAGGQRGQARAEERRPARAAAEPDRARSGQGERPAAKAEARAPDAFATYDRNGDGAVTLEEYVRVEARAGGVTRSEATRLFEVLAKGDRLMTRKEFSNPSSRYERLSERFRSN